MRFQVWIEAYRFADEVVDRTHGLNSGEPRTCDDKGKCWLAVPQVPGTKLGSARFTLLARLPELASKVCNSCLSWPDPLAAGFRDHAAAEVVIIGAASNAITCLKYEKGLAACTAQIASCGQAPPGRRR